jgi:hypothetical protein
MSRRPPRKAKGTARKAKGTARKAKASGKGSAPRKATSRQRTSPMQGGVRQRKPTAGERTGGSVVDQFAPRLREEFARLQKQEARIIAGLEDPEISRHFLEDPVGALDRMKVDVPPILRKRLRAQARPDLLFPRQFRLPNGQVVTPQVTVRFTSGKGGSR